MTPSTLTLDSSIGSYADGMNVYCPNCGAYKGKKNALKVTDGWMKCAGGCESMNSTGKVIVKGGGGTDFPIHYSFQHVRDNDTDVIATLLGFGYTEINEVDTPGTGEDRPSTVAISVEPAERKQHSHILRQQKSDTIFGPISSFISFIKDNKPQYLEVIDKSGKPHFLHLNGTDIISNSLRIKLQKVLGKLWIWN